MSTIPDFFRPTQEPLATIYDAFQEEASHRKGRALEVWIKAELDRVFQTACDVAPKYGLRAPTREEVDLGERMARGHSDYGRKWALYVVEAMSRPAPTPKIHPHP